VVRAEESSAAGAEVAVGRAVERSGWAAGGLSREDTVRLSKFTAGRKAEAVVEAWLGSSQEKEIVPMSRQVESFAEMGFCWPVSQSMDSAIATASLVKWEKTWSSYSMARYLAMKETWFWASRQ
jgi:hypothetical protein